MALKSFSLNDGSASILFTPAIGGDGRSAQWTSKAMGTTVKGHPTLFLKQRENNTGTVRTVSRSLAIPVEVITDEGVSVPHVIRIRGEYVLPTSVPAATLAKALSMDSSLCADVDLVALVTEDVRVNVLI